MQADSSHKTFFFSLQDKETQTKKQYDNFIYYLERVSTLI